MLSKIFAVICCAAEMSARNRKINIYFAPSRLEKKGFFYFYLMDMSRRCVRISAAEINIMQILERRIVWGSVESGYFDFDNIHIHIINIFVIIFVGCTV